MVGVGRDLCGSSSPTPLPKQGRLQQAAQDLDQAGLEYLQRTRLQLSKVPVLGYLLSPNLLQGAFLPPGLCSDFSGPYSY